MSLYDELCIMLGAVFFVGTIVWAIFSEADPAKKRGIVTCMVLLIALGGVIVPILDHEALQKRHQIYAEVTRVHPDFRIQSIATDTSTITYVRPNKPSGHYLCSAKLFFLNNHYLVATLGAQCVPYTAQAS